MPTAKSLLLKHALSMRADGLVQLFESRPFLAVPVHELAFIFANRTTSGRFNGGRVLSATGCANPAGHCLVPRSTSTTGCPFPVTQKCVVPAPVPRLYVGEIEVN